MKVAIDNLEAFAGERWFSASYAGHDGLVYDVVFVRSYIHSIGYESTELANVLRDVTSSASSSVTVWFG